jgi:hypothetical protein
VSVCLLVVPLLTQSLQQQPPPQSQTKCLGVEPRKPLPTTAMNEQNITQLRQPVNCATSSIPVPGKSVKPSKTSPLPRPAEKQKAKSASRTSTEPVRMQSSGFEPRRLAQRRLQNSRCLAANIGTHRIAASCVWRSKQPPRSTLCKIFEKKKKRKKGFFFF